MLIYDSTNPDDIPEDAQCVLGYLDGDYPTYNQCKLRFPNAVVLSVTVEGNTKADIVDVENGAVTPQTAAAGVKNGLYPTVYFSASRLSEIQAAMAAVGSPKWQAFPADWTGVPHIPAWAVACQYAHPPQTAGHYDLSISIPSYPPNQPTPPLPAQPTEEQLMQAFTNKEGQQTIIGVQANPSGLASTGHLLRWTETSPGTWDVEDLTALVGPKDAGQPFLMVP